MTVKFDISVKRNNNKKLRQTLFIVNNNTNRFKFPRQRDEKDLVTDKRVVVFKLQRSHCSAQVTIRPNDNATSPPCQSGIIIRKNAVDFRSRA